MAEDHKKWKSHRQRPRIVSLGDTPGQKYFRSQLGASSSSFTTAALWVLVASARSSIAYARVRSDAVQLAEVQNSFATPREPKSPADNTPAWFDAWKLVLHNQIDGLFEAIEQRPKDSSGPRSESSPHLRPESGNNEFTIAMVGDSTMRMQAKALAWLLGQRDELTCNDWSKRTDSNLVDVHCSRPGSNGDNSGSLTVHVHYVKTIDECLGEKVDADYVYFGCGLRLLQLIPDRKQTAGALDTWVHYERLLEEAVLYYRAGGASGGARIPVGEAFMTTHSFADEVLDGQFEIRVREYEEKNEALLTTCRETVGDIKPLHGQWNSDYQPEDICTLGTFDELGVLDLNRRAEPIMSRLGVPMVRAYDITQGQVWATQPADGRHYPAMIPVELNSFVSEVTTALRIEKRTSSRGAD